MFVSKEKAIPLVSAQKVQDDCRLFLVVALHSLLQRSL